MYVSEEISIPFWQQSVQVALITSHNLNICKTSVNEHHFTWQVLGIRSLNTTSLGKSKNNKNSKTKLFLICK